ncbi:protease inhibitor I42 family protein [Christiangramia echinicola]|uniref:protease inhibitor I42 family protein n=1 Tax=Christiangramia echinicola TaxID=279359 RepID=UPI000415CB98|nr:protease inhibitor I42 family protein [Christiangramia echinicola]
MKKLLFLIFLLSFYSCKVTTVEKQDFKIDLQKDGTGGYVWNYIPSSPDITLVDSVRIPMKDSTGFIRYLRQYNFRATQLGLYKLQFIKKRPFSKSKDTAEIVEKFWIRIKE